MSDYRRFIADQVWQLLTEFEHPQPHLHTSQFRAGRPGMAAPSQLPGENAAADPWVPIPDHLQVADNSLNLGDWEPAELDLSRLVVTTDAGIGKTVAIQWLVAAINRRGTGRLAFLVPKTALDGPLPDLHDRLFTWLASQVRNESLDHGCSLADAARIVDRYRRTGSLTLCFDGLDQIGDDIGPLAEILEATYWSACRFVVAGRPFAIQKHWQRLFAKCPARLIPETGHVRPAGWRFVKLDEFDPDQQRAYLDKNEDGDRYDQIPEDARPILGVPRVLHYLRGMHDSRYSQIATASDVYYFAITELVTQGMKQSAGARMMDWNDHHPPSEPQSTSIQKALELLGAIAFEMTAQEVPVPRASSSGEAEWEQKPNFYSVPRAKFNRFRTALEQRFRSSNFSRDWSAISALNTVLTHAVFDSGVEGLVEIEFRNRSLQEWLCAYYLAQHASPDDSRRPWDWVYLPDRPETEEYYYVWQFLCEMHANARDETIWLESVEPLYRPCFQDPQGGWDARRSNEMIFRSWPRLEEYCRQGVPRALKIRQQWWGEFEQTILAGQRGPAAAKMAREFQEDLLVLPEGSFQMGSPPEKQGMPPAQRAYWEGWIANAPSGSFPEYVDVELDRYTWSGKAGARLRVERRSFLIGVLEGGGIEAIERAFYASDETPVHSTQQIASFELGRSPLLNAWYRLYSPRHGLPPSLFAADYARYSPSDRHPAISVSWFDAWAFCLWARWDNQSCRLPWENEWEYACKFESAWDRNYWWGDDFDENLANADMRVGTTTVPSRKHVNPHTRVRDPRGIGLQEMIGDVWEWCQDIYRARYERRESDIGSSVHLSRVLRGGSFDRLTDVCRSAYRIHGHPASAFHSWGVRVARALRKP